MCIRDRLGNLNFGQAEFLPGLRSTLFKVDADGRKIIFPALICFESIFPDLVRKFARRGANLLVTISNDAWYGRSSEPFQIAAISRFRCIETRRSMARATNTGISQLVDPLGRTVKRSELFSTTWIIAELPLLSQETFYVKHGDLFLAVVTLFYGLALLAAVIRKNQT